MKLIVLILASSFRDMSRLMQALLEVEVGDRIKLAHSWACNLHILVLVQKRTLSMLMIMKMRGPVLYQ